MSRTAKTARPSTATAPSAPAAPAVAKPTSAPRRDAEAPRGPTVAQKVFIHCFSSGPRGCLSAMPLHEVVLCKRKLEIFGESLTLTTDWPEYVPRERDLTAAELQEEHKRLVAIYSFEGNDGKKYDLVQDVFGPAHQGRLRAVMRKQFDAWRQLEKKLDGKLLLEHWQDIALLADPEQEFVEPGDLLADAKS